MTRHSSLTQASTSIWSIFLIFLKLGLTSFGGPVAHLGYFREEFVDRRKWLSDRSYADLVALAQFLPGPASSQVGLALGLSQRGYRGAFAAWAGFTLPSAIALIIFAQGIAALGDAVPTGMLSGLKIVALAVVVQAVWGMARSLCPDTKRATLMTASAFFVVLVPAAWSQVAVIVIAALIGLKLFAPEPATAHEALPLTLPKSHGLIWLGLFFVLLLGLPLLTNHSHLLAMIEAFYRAGSLVFGGGHVVLPLLQAEVVTNSWVSNDTFLAGYGATQAVPGPLFTFSAFLGASMTQAPSGWTGGLIALLAIFAPSFLLIAGAMPFWEALRRHPRVQCMLKAVNAAVVGLLLAALYDPVWTSAIHKPADFALALVALAALMVWKWPPWLVVLLGAAAGHLMHWFGIA